MCAMRDITNYFVSINEESRFERASDENVFVSSAPSFPRVQQQVLVQANKRIQETVDSSSSDGDVFEIQRKKKHKMDLDKTSSVFETPEETDEAQRTKPPNRPAPRKRLRLEQKGTSTPLAVSLKGLTKPQLIDLLTTLSLRHPELDKEMKDLMPEPDLSELEEKLTYLKRNIYKSFPHSRWGSKRDAFSFRRVNTHLQAFKKECVAQGHNLVSSQLWKAAINYVLIAWSYVEEMPNWDSPSHNSSKEQCFKSLAVQCKASLQKSSLTRDEYTDIQRRLSEVHETNRHIEPCLDEIAKILKKL